MRIVGGRFNGTGADLYVCVGFVPDFVKVWNVESATPCSIEWDKNMTDILTIEGVYVDNAGGATQDMAFGEGIAPYFGGETLTTTLAGVTTYGEGVYLKWDDYDYRYYNGNKPLGDAVAEDIISWTLDTLANRTGHFNEDVTGTYIGEGSKIIIDSPGLGPREYTILALTAGQGEAADEVTLNYAAPSGPVRYISGMYSMKPMIAGEVTPAGFLLSMATVNANGNICAFTAGTFSR